MRRAALAAALALGAPATARAQEPQPPVIVPPPTAPAEPAPAPRAAALGVAVGSPGFVNLTASYQRGSLAVRAAGGAGGHGRAGGQADLGWRAVRVGRLAFGPALVGGAVTSQDLADADRAARADVPARGARDTHAYAGAVFELEVAGLRAQLGLARALGRATHQAELLAQVGYDYPLGRRARRRD